MAVLTLLVQLRPGRAIDTVRRVDLSRCLAASAALVLAQALGAVAWHFCFRAAGASSPAPLELVRCFYVSIGFGAVTPASVGGDAYRLVVTRRLGASLSSGLRISLYQRVFSLAGAAAVACPALVFLPVGARGPLVALSLGSVLALPVLLVLLTRAPGLGRGKAFLLATLAAVASVVHHAACTFSLGVVAAAVMPDAPAATLWSWVSVARLIGMLAPVPGAAGILESAYAYMGRWAGAPLEAGLVVAAAQRIALFTIAVVALFIQPRDASR